MTQNIINLNYDIYSKLTKLETDFLSYINQNPEFVIQNTIKDIGTDAFISPASIIRFCKKLGYSSFSEFRYHLRTLFINKPNNLQNKKIIEVINHQFNLYLNAIDISKIIEIVPLLTQSNILLYGKGTNAYFIDYLATQLSLLNLSVLSYRDAQLAKVYASNIGQGGIALILCYSGETQVSIDLALSAKQNHYKIILITRNIQSSLASIADYCLLIPEEALNSYSSKNIHVKTNFCLVCLMDILLQYIISYQNKCF
ncbi:MurR/RpiR family transcriptional regulator [Candidatus Epulonipiscium viviparus]|uniref:MurR/RpiR family transcriptional regulator n=1 Tax=Candidatus Epulonipiscium viviparus TaxID=420336 RepID=UPI00016C007A|nr:MurR/RpiR family transcriptional regulator [Candidatus Epulopiscium viviparus]